MAKAHSFVGSAGNVSCRASCCGYGSLDSTVLARGLLPNRSAWEGFELCES
jgi:hypothetical protein